MREGVVRTGKRMQRVCTGTPVHWVHWHTTSEQCGKECGALPMTRPTRPGGHSSESAACSFGSDPAAAGAAAAAR